MSERFGKFLMGEHPSHHKVDRCELPPDLRNRFAFGRQVVQLDAPVAYQLNHTLYLVFPGFYTDFSSIPFFLPRPHQTDAPGVIHDALCRGFNRIPGMTWNKAAGIYYSACRACGVSKMSSQYYYMGLVFRGWFGHLNGNTNPDGFLEIIENYGQADD